MVPPPFTKVTSTNADNPETALPDHTLAGSNSTPQCLKDFGFMRRRASCAFMQAKPLYRSLAKELRGMFLGPMLLEEFLDTCLPCRQDRTCLNTVISVSEADFKLKKRARGETSEDTICDAINNAKVLRNLHLQNTSDATLSMLDSLPESERANRKIDNTFLLRKNGLIPPPSFEELRLPIELKPFEVDIVADLDGKSPEDRKQHGFDHQTADALKARGQLVRYKPNDYAAYA
ncbi:unnamed protein product [Peniophora sp. CBMAI 1063]|nr:unnamed protein product [Peniophora sp. CBMAI 1063]